MTDLRKVIFGRWPSPATTAEGKADWDDDLAVLYVEYGWQILSDAIGFHRQHTDKRPAFPAIREQCRLIREKAGKRADSDEEAIREHRHAIRKHLADPFDNSMIPIGLLFRDTLDFLALKAECRAKNYTPNPEEMRKWKEQRAKATAEEWRAMRLEGVVGISNPLDGHSRRSGTGLQSAGAIASENNP